MNIHMNARLTPLHREKMARAVVEGHLSKAHAARIYGVSAKIVAHWVERSSQPRHSPNVTDRTVVDARQFLLQASDLSGLITIS